MAKPDAKGAVSLKGTLKGDAFQVAMTVTFQPDGSYSYLIQRTFSKGTSEAVKEVYRNRDVFRGVQLNVTTGPNTVQGNVTNLANAAEITNDGDTVRGSGHLKSDLDGAIVARVVTSDTLGNTSSNWAASLVPDAYYYDVPNASTRASIQTWSVSSPPTTSTAGPLRPSRSTPQPSGGEWSL
jgi:hypothetical protein